MEDVKVSGILGFKGLAARRLRDERMVNLGVRMEDVKVGAGTGSVWKLEDPAILHAEVRAFPRRSCLPVHPSSCNVCSLDSPSEVFLGWQANYGNNGLQSALVRLLGGTVTVKVLKCLRTWCYSEAVGAGKHMCVCTLQLEEARRAVEAAAEKKRLAAAQREAAAAKKAQAKEQAQASKAKREAEKAQKAKAKGEAVA